MCVTKHHLQEEAEEAEEAEERLLPVDLNVDEYECSSISIR